MKYLTHWTFAFVTLFVLTFMGVKDPQIKDNREVWSMALEKRRISKCNN